MKRGIRLLLVTIIGIFEAFSIILTLATFDRSLSEFGYNVGPDGVTIIAVEPGLPAARAGIVPGDRVVYDSLPLPGRLSAILNETVSPETELTIRIRHGESIRTVRMRPEPLPRLYGATDLSDAFAGFCLGAVSLVLVVVRPSRMTWAFALIVPPVSLPEAAYLWPQSAPPAQGLTASIALAILYGIQSAAIMTFASRFPTNSPVGIARVVDRLAIPLGAMAACVYAATDVAIWLAASPPPRWLLTTQDYIAPTLPNLLAVVAIVATYVASERSLRSRLAPALAAMVLTLLSGVAQQFGEISTSNATVLIATYFVFAGSSALLAIAVAYGVIRHRVIDVDFFIGRTLVYGALTAFAVSVFSLIEYLFGKLLEHRGLATTLEILAAVAIGLSLNALHSRVDHFIDRVLFRRRHIAEARVARSARNVAFANSSGIVDELVVNEPADALGLASAAIFAVDVTSDAFVRRQSVGWGPHDAASLDGDDHLIIRMRAELQAGDLSDLRWPRDDVPGGARQPIYAIPIVVARRLHAIALYGAHASGEDLDPDERASLRQLAAGAALAYDHLTTQALRDRVESLRSEIAALRHSERTLAAIVSERLPARRDPDGA